MVHLQGSASTDFETLIASRDATLRAQSARVFGFPTKVTSLATYTDSVIVESEDGRRARVIFDGAAIERVVSLSNPRAVLAEYTAAILRGDPLPPTPLRLIEEALAATDRRPDHVVRSEAVQRLRGTQENRWFRCLGEPVVMAAIRSAPSAVTEGLDSGRFLPIPKVLSEADDRFYRPLAVERVSTAARSFDTVRATVCRALRGTTPASVREAWAFRLPGLDETILEFTIHMKNLSASLHRTSRTASSACELAEIHESAMEYLPPAQTFATFVQQALRPSI